MLLRLYVYHILGYYLFGEFPTNRKRGIIFYNITIADAFC